MSTISGTSIQNLISGFLSGAVGQGTLTVVDILANMTVALLLALLIFVTYRVSHTGEVYSARFNVSLVMLTLVTTMVMNVIGNNVALSLGMVGALSIVRFRTAIRDSRDTAFIFWTVAVGICCGVSDYLVALLGSMFVFVYLVLFGMVRENERVLIIVRGSEDALAQADRVVGQHYARKASLRVSNVNNETHQGEAIYEISSTLKDKFESKNGTVQSALSSVRGITGTSVVRQDDEISQ